MSLNESLSVFSVAPQTDGEVNTDYTNKAFRNGKILTFE